MRVTGYLLLYSKRQNTVNYQEYLVMGYTEVLCHLKELTRNIINLLKLSTEFSQINWPKSFFDDLQYTISLMYIESYWLLYSNRENT